MNTRLLKLDAGNEKARDCLRENLKVCGWDHTLSRKLLLHYPDLDGSTVAIVPDWLELAKLPAYKYTITPPKGLGSYDNGQRPVDRIVAFISDYLSDFDDAIVVCENFRWTRRTYENWTDGTAIASYFTAKLSRIRCRTSVERHAR
jgi:hypothetical protein